MKKQAGFTLIEMLVVVGMIGILAAIAVPLMKPLWENARYKEATRDVTSALRDARNRAISQNVEFRVDFNLTARTYSLSQGNLSSGSTNWPNPILNYGTLPTGVLMAADDGDETCGVTTGSHYFEFNPNGTSENDIGDPAHICILDADGLKKFATGLVSNTTGRIKIRRRNSADTDWID